MGVLEFKLSRVDSFFQGRLHDFNVNYIGFQDPMLTVFAVKNPGGVCVTVFALKNPGRVDRVLSKKFYSGSVDLEEHLLARRATADCGGRRPKGYF